MFEDRKQAGNILSRKLYFLKGKKSLLCLGIPRGGVVIASVISKKLSIPLGVVVTKKIGAPNQPELAIGAVGPEATLVLDKKLIAELGVEKEWLEKEVKSKRQEVKEREKKFRKGREPLEIEGKTILLIDDGIATGSTVEVAIKYLKKVGAKKLILAVPLASRDAADRFRKLVHKSVFLETPDNFYAVGQFYKDFPQVMDEEVIQLLQ